MQKFFQVAKYFIHVISLRWDITSNIIYNIWIFRIKSFILQEIYRFIDSLIDFQYPIHWMSTNRRRPIDTAECRSTRYFRCERADDLRSHRQPSPSWEDETRTMRSSAVWETGWSRVKSLRASFNYVRRREDFPVQWMLARAGCRHSGWGIFVLGVVGYVARHRIHRVGVKDSRCEVG